MADPLTPNIGLDLPPRNSYINTWDTVVNANWSAIDAKLGGSIVLTLSNQNIALTTQQAQNNNIYFNGALTASVTAILPAGFAGLFSVLNGATGLGFQVVLQTANNGTALVLPQGLRVLVISDGVNVMLANQALPPGTVLPWLTNAIPGGFILPFGQVLAQANYPGIYAAYGASFNTGGEGSGNFRMPDLRGLVLAGLDNMGGAAKGFLTVFGSSGQQVGAIGGEQLHILATGEMPVHSHGVTDPGHGHATAENPHSHGYVLTNNGNSGGGGGPAVANNGTTKAQTDATSTGLTVSNSTTGISLANTGSGNAHNNVQPAMLCNWIVKT